MKFKFQILLLSSLVFLSTSCKDDKKNSDKDDKDTESSAGYSNIGGSEQANAQVFGNMLSSLPNTGGAFKMDLMQLIKKSGIQKNKETGLMVTGVLMQVNKVLDIDQPIRVTVSGENADDISVLGMIAIKDKDELINELKSNLDGAEFEDANGFTFGTINMESVRLKLGLNNNFCLIHYSDKFMNKEESIAAMESYFAAGATKTEFAGNVDSYLASTEDFALMLSPENMMGFVPEDKMKGADLNNEEIKDGWTNLSLDFVLGSIKMAAHNDYPNAKSMDFAGKGLPTEYASLLTNDQLVGFGGGSVDVTKMLSLAKASNADLGKFEEKMGIPLEEFAASFDGTMTIAMTDIPNADEWLNEKLNDNTDAVDVSDQFADLTDDQPASKDHSGDMPVVIDKAQKAGEDMLTKMVMTIGLTEETLISGIIDTMKNAEKKGDYYVLKSKDDGESSGFLAIKNNKMMISGNEDIIKTFSSEGTLAMAAEAKPYMSTAFNAFLSFDLIKDLLTTREGAEDIMEIQVLDMFKDMVLQGNLEDLTLNVNMDDSGSNSFKQILELILANASDLMGAMPAM